MDMSHLTARELLALHSKVADELVARRITRTYNNPTGDLAESLFCKAFGWNQAGKSFAHVDAIGPDGAGSQIKGRRVTRLNKSRQLGALRDLASTRRSEAAVAGTALLPWEEWLARLLHPIIVALRRWSYQRRHTRDLLEQRVRPRRKALFTE